MSKYLDHFLSKAPVTSGLQTPRLVKVFTSTRIAVHGRDPWGSVQGICSEYRTSFSCDKLNQQLLSQVCVGKWLPPLFQKEHLQKSDFFTHVMPRAITAGIALKNKCSVG